MSQDTRPATPLEQFHQQQNALEHLSAALAHLSHSQEMSRQEQEAQRQTLDNLTSAMNSFVQHQAQQTPKLTSHFHLPDIAVFDGNVTEYRTWKDTLLAYFEAKGPLPEADKLAYLYLRLSGPARTFFANWRASPGYNPHFTAALSALDARYTDANAAFLAALKLNELKQTTNMQSHLNLFNDLLAQTSLPKDDEAVITRLLLTLPLDLSRRVRDASLAEPALRTYANLERRLLDWEAHASNGPAPPPADLMDLSVLEVKHRYPATKAEALQKLKTLVGVPGLKQLNFCEACVEYVGYPASHSATSTCPKANKGTLKAYINSISGSLYVTLDFSNGRSIKALVDSGAQGALYMSPAAAASSGASLIRPGKVKQLKSFQGDIVASVTQVTLPLSFKYRSTPFREPFDIINDLPIPAIIGFDFLKRHGVIIDYDQKALLFVKHSQWHRLRAMATNPTIPCLESGERQPFSPTLSTVDVVEVPQYLAEFKDVFSSALADRLPPPRPSQDMHLELKPNSTLPKTRMYKLSAIEEDTLREEVQKGLASGKIVRSTSRFASPVLFVKKNDGRLRMCVDYRKINDATESIKATLPIIDEILDRANGSALYSKIDLKGAFNLLRMAPQSEPLTAFQTKFGLFQYRVVPFGLKNGPTVFQSLMNEIFHDLMGQGMDFFIDDLLIYEPDTTIHKSLLREVFKRLLANDLAVGLDKCQFMVPAVDFLGHHLSVAGLSMQTSKVQAIMDYALPRNVKELRSFLGICNYYRAFIPHYSHIASPLNALTGHDVKFKLNSEATAAIGKLKDAFENGPVLTKPDNSKRFYLQTDASDFALGAVLHQLNDEKGCLQPIAFFSRKFAPRELNYTVYEKELLAIINALNHWRYLLIDVVEPTIIHCDHRNLGFFKEVQYLNRRQARWNQDLQEYSFVIEYTKGSLMHVADPLSRNPIFSTRAGDPERMLNKVQMLPDNRFSTTPRRSSHGAQALRSIFQINAIAQDSPIQSLIHGYSIPDDPLAPDPASAYPQEPIPGDDESTVANPALTNASTWPVFMYQYKLLPDLDRLPVTLPAKYKQLIIRNHKHFVVRGNSLFRKVTVKGRTLLVQYLAKRLRSREMRKIHESMGHLGSPSIGDLLKSKWWWPGLNEDYIRFCRACHDCQIHQRRPRIPVQPLHPIPPAGLPFRRWGIDFIQDIPNSRSGNTQIITLIDYATRFVVAKAVPDRTGSTVAKFLYSVMLRFGAPEEIVSDRASAFTSDVLQSYLNLQEVNHFPSTPYHPNTNGCVERMHDVLWPMLLKMSSGVPERWDEYLAPAVFAINSRTHTVTGFSPFYLVYGVEPRLPGGPVPPFEFNFANPDDRFAYTQRTLLELGQDRAAAYFRTERQAERMAQDHNRLNSIKISQFKVGDQVLLKNNTKTKLQARFLGPFYVSRIGLHDTYYLKRTVDPASELQHPYNRCYLIPYVSQSPTPNRRSTPREHSSRGVNTVIIYKR